MKKTVIAVIAVALALVAIVTVFAVRLAASPQAMLLGVSRDLSRGGLRAIEPYLSGNALRVSQTLGEVADEIGDLGDSVGGHLVRSLVGKVAGSDGTSAVSDFLRELTDNASQMTFEARSVSRSGNAGVCTLEVTSGKYEGKQILLILVRQNGQWSICDVALPMGNLLMGG